MARLPTPRAPPPLLSAEDEARIHAEAEERIALEVACLQELRDLQHRVGPLVIAQAHRALRNSTEYEAALATPGHALARKELTRLHEHYADAYAWAWGLFVSEGCKCPPCTGGES